MEHTAKSSSKCALSGPADGSEKFWNIVEFSGTRNHPSWLENESTRGPVRLVFHWSRASASRVAFRSRLSNVPLELTSQDGRTTGWSVRFCPTEGRWATGVMPRADKLGASPIPESSRICGVPMLPAERITSFLAITRNRVAPDDRFKEAPTRMMINTNLRHSGQIQRSEMWLRPCHHFVEFE
jgi:hypothetical protein